MAKNRKRKFWGWGYENQGPTPEQQKHMAERMAKRFGLRPLELTPPPKESELNLRAPRIKPPAALEALCSTSTHDRAGHTYGKSSRDIGRASGAIPDPFDLVAFRAMTRANPRARMVRRSADRRNSYGGGSARSVVSSPRGDPIAAPSPSI